MDAQNSLVMNRKEEKAKALQVATLKSWIQIVMAILVPAGMFFYYLETKFDRIENKFDAVDARFNAVDARFDQVDARFDKVDRRLDSIEGRLNGVEGRLSNVENELRKTGNVLDSYLTWEFLYKNDPARKHLTPRYDPSTRTLEFVPK